MIAARSWGCPTTTTTDTAPACLAASKSGCKTACGGGCGGIMTARMGCSVSSPTNVCSDNINAGRFLGRAPGADRFATYIPGKPDAGNPPVRFDEGREPAGSPRAAYAYPTPVCHSNFRLEGDEFAATSASFLGAEAVNGVAVPREGAGVGLDPGRRLRSGAGLQTHLEVRRFDMTHFSLKKPPFVKHSCAKCGWFFRSRQKILHIRVLTVRCS